MSKDIKIFVSHRIDLDSEIIDNPLYVNVRCGAKYDTRENVDMLGDDTGDNISDKRDYFSELTVQYWAWKNQNADYYGLCHYRRYFVFDEETSAPYNEAHHYMLKSMKQARKYGFSDSDLMRGTIESHDMILGEYNDVRKMPTTRGKKESVYDYWCNRPELMDKKYLDRMISYIQEYDEEIYKYAMQYLSGYDYRGYNCFIMKKAYFYQMCDFQFTILLKLHSEIDYTKCSAEKAREIGYMGEILFAIYCYYAIKAMNVRVKILPIAFIEDTKKMEELQPASGFNNIPIVLMSSEYYLPYVGVFVQSIIEHANNGYTYDIVILTQKISQIDKNRFKRMCKNNDNISIRFFDLSHIVKEYDFYVASESYSVEAYFRLLVPWILKKYNKAIVMDSDIILNEDILELFNEDVDGYCFGAVKDAVYQGMLNGPLDWKEYANNEMGMENPYNYVNTGVLLMNLKHIRDEFDKETLLNFARNHKMRIQEQDILNMFFENRIKFLNPKYNFSVEVNNWVSEQLSYAPIEAANDYKKAKENPVVIHFANRPKPWEDVYMEYAEDFMEVAKRTPFYYIVLMRLSEYRIRILQPNDNWLGCNNSWIYEHMGGNLYARFIFPWRAVKPGANIIIYGGGIVGKTFLRQLSNNPYCHVIMVVDKNPTTTGIVEVPVVDINSLAEMDYDIFDLVLIALETKEIAVSVRQDLELMGIPADKIKWVDPHRR